VKRLAVLVLLVAAGCGGSTAAPKRAAAPVATPVAPVVDAPCRPPRVNYMPYPGGDESMSGIPWIEGEPREHGLVGLLWYWSEEWLGVRRAQVFTGGVAPAGYSAKVLWAFLSPSVRDMADGELLIEGRSLDGPGRFRETFSAISYAGQGGAPSYASGLDLPTPGCWRLWLTTGKLRAVVDIRAGKFADLTPPACEPGRVKHDGREVWIEGSSRSSGLRAYLGYWPERWRGITRARVYTEGRAPGGSSAKVMWAFVGPDARDRGGSRLVLSGHNLDGPGTVRDSFAAISYEGQNGAPSYASIVDLPHPGCWRLTVTTAGLRGTVDIEAVAP
jgi:hypothetical protein